MTTLYRSILIKIAVIRLKVATKEPTLEFAAIRLLKLAAADLTELQSAVANVEVLANNVVETFTILSVTLEKHVVEISMEQIHVVHLVANAVEAPVVA